MCKATKTQRAQCRIKTEHKPDDLPAPEAFADRITADHAILNDEDASREGDKVLLVVQDAHTKWIQSYPAQTKSTEEVVMALKKFLGPQTIAKHAYTDNAGEFDKAF